jgi:IclR family transcriptional regulator, acetate operon repressor
MINSVLKAAQILDLFSPERPRQTLAQLSEASGYPKTTLYTIAATLVHAGLLERVGDTYALGKHILRLSQAARVNVEVRDRAAPILRELADTTRESVYLTVPDGAWVLYVYAIESSHRLQARSAIGDRAHFHSTSVGKAMLAFMEGAARESIIAAGLPAVTANTIGTAEELRTELDAIRTRGYSIDHSENEANTFCIGAPILDHTASLVGACSVSGSSEELITSRLAEFAPMVVEAADRVSRRMGYVPARPQVWATASPET